MVVNGVCVRAKRTASARAETIATSQERDSESLARVEAGVEGGGNTSSKHTARTSPTDGTDYRRIQFQTPKTVYISYFLFIERKYSRPLSPL